MHGSFASLSDDKIEIFSVPRCLRGEKLLKALHHHSNPLPATDARRSQPVLLLPPPQFIQQRNHQPRSGRSQRMAQGNRSAVHVHFFAIESQFFLHRQILRRERLIHFDQVDVIQSEPRTLQRTLRRRNRTAPHHLRIDARNSPIHDPSQRTQISFLRLLQRHHHHCGGAVDNPARVPRRYSSILPKSSPQLRQAFHRRLWTPVVVFSQHLSRRLALRIPHRNRRQLFLHASGFVRLIGLLLRAQRELVLRLPRDALLLAV